jgi:hypothetical protein
MCFALRGWPGWAPPAASAAARATSVRKALLRITAAPRREGVPSCSTDSRLSPHRDSRCKADRGGDGGMAARLAAPCIHDPRASIRSLRTVLASAASLFRMGESYMMWVWQRCWNKDAAGRWAGGEKHTWSPRRSYRGRRRVCKRPRPPAPAPRRRPAHTRSALLLVSCLGQMMADEDTPALI